MDSPFGVSISLVAADSRELILEVDAGKRP